LFLQICDRFINRRALQRLYNKALGLGLKGYAELHQHVFSRLADWEGILKSRSVRDYDYSGTRLLGKFETVDTYYRQTRSSAFVGNVTVPLLCISALDDPVCTKEAIPWDECRANKNIVLATTQHGGHLAYYQGITAKSLWWVGAVHEFFSVLHSSSLIRRKKEAQMQSSPLISPPESSIDQGPYINITEDGMVAAMADEQTNVDDINTEPVIQSDKNEDVISEIQGSDRVMGKQTHLTDESPQPPGQEINDIIMPKGIYMDQLSRHSRKSLWLLAYIAIVTTWPLVGPALRLFFKKRFRNMLPGISRTAPR